jgi:hypothetical protein
MYFKAILFNFLPFFLGIDDSIPVMANCAERICFMTCCFTTRLNGIQFFITLMSILFLIG